jgi:opacity protein-like surface antigen
MIRALFLGLILAVSAQIAYAQDYHGGEIYVGYSHNRVDTGFPRVDFDDPDFDDFDDFDDLEDFFDQKTGFHGFEVSATGNFSRYLGAKFDVTGHYHSDELFFTLEPGNVDQSVYNILGGIQIKDNSDDGGRFRPFGHVLAGVGIARTDFDVPDLLVATPFQDFEDFQNFDDDFDETGFAAAFGGGVDIRLSDRVDLRAIQVDYNPTYFFNSTQHNVRIGIGLVFH